MTRRWWIVMMVLALGCAAAPGAIAGSEGRPARSDGRADGKVNVNEASKAELMKLAGVGPGTAERIIAYRQAHGRFKRPQDLEKVEGVGKAVLEKNAGRITVK